MSLIPSAHACMFDFLWCLYVGLISCPKNVIGAVHIYNPRPISTRICWNFIYRLPLNGQSRVRNLSGYVWKISLQNLGFWCFWGSCRNPKYSPTNVKFNCHSGMVMFSVTLYRVAKKVSCCTVSTAYFFEPPCRPISLRMYV